MSISVSCSCGAKLNVKDEAGGKKAKCPKCGAVVPVPPKSPDAPAEAIAAAAQYCRYCDQLLASGTFVCGACGKPTKNTSAALEAPAPKLEALDPPPDTVYLEVGQEWLIGSRKFEGAVLATDKAFYLLTLHRVHLDHVSQWLGALVDAFDRKWQEWAPTQVPFAAIAHKMTCSESWPLDESQTKALMGGHAIVIPREAVQSLKTPWMATLTVTTGEQSIRIDGLNDKNMVRHYLTEWGWKFS